MAKRLAALGTRWRTSGWRELRLPANTVYFAANHKKEAKALSSRLGKDTIVKP
jgi:hypothetical protein